MKFTNLPIARQLLLGAVVPMMLFVGLAWVSMDSLKNAQTDEDWVEHTQEVLGLASHLEKLLVDLETGERGYIITGETSFLEPYKNAREQINQAFNKLQLLIIDDPGQANRVKKVYQLKEQWLGDVAEKIIKVRSQVPENANNTQAFEERFSHSPGKAIIADIRSHIKQIDQGLAAKRLDRGRLLNAKVLQSIIETESQQHVFLVSSNEKAIPPYLESQHKLSKDLEALIEYGVAKKLNPKFFQKIDQISELYNRWRNTVGEPEIEARRQAAAHQATLRQSFTLIAGKSGKNLMDEMRSELNRFTEVEQALLNQRRQNSEQVRSQTLWTIVLGTLVSVFLALFSFLWVVRRVNVGLQKITEQSILIGQGAIPELLKIKQKDEVGRVAASLDRLLVGLRQKLSVANKLAEGDTEQEVVLLSDQDEMGQAMIDLVKRLKFKAKLVAQVAEGDLNTEVVLASQQDYLGRSLRAMLASLKEKERLVQQVVEGDLLREAPKFAESDLLGKSLGVMVGTLREVAKQADQIASGDYVTTITPRSDQDLLGIALSQMTHALKESKDDATQQDWLKNGQNLLNMEIRGELNDVQLAKKSITFLAKYLEAKVGVFYSYEENSEFLTLTASYAFSKRKGLSDRFAMGEGLVGQTALEKTMISVTQVPEDYMRIGSAVGDSVPRNVLLVPLLFNGELKGVIELASFEEFDQTAMEFLETATDSIAIGIQSARAQSRMAELLEETQRQSEEMQRQQEELEISNQELSQRTLDMEQQKESVEKQNLLIEKSRARLETQTRELSLSSKYKSEFMANMSHELRTPLNSILLLSQTMSESSKHKNLTEKQRKSVNTIYNSGFYLLSLINEILDLSKIEAGKLELKPVATSLEHFKAELETDFAHTAEDSKLEYELTVAEGLPTSIMVDRLRLNQVMKNLLSNAFKFTDQGKVTVTINPATPQEQDALGGGEERWVAFRVQDSGIGIPEDQQMISFEAFKQLDGGLSRRYDGTGLGLSISRELSHLMGGKVFLESQVGVGSTFSLVIPLTTPRPEDVEPQSPTQVYGKPIPLNILDEPKVPLILVIEDDPHFADILKDRCQEMSYQCHITDSGKEGIKLAEQLLPTGIVLDVRLPDIDGLSVLKSLSENPKTKHIPVHILTAYELDEDPVAQGAVNFLTKPISKGQLESLLKNLSTGQANQIASILLVEDDQDLREVVADLLAETGRKVTALSQGQEAIDAVQTQAFDCVILDLTLQDIDGFTVLEKIRQFSASLPVVIYTGRDLNEEEEQRLAIHTDSVVIKSDHAAERLIDEVDLFINRLPIAESAPVPATEDTNLSSVSGKKLLLVDDDMRNLFALCQVFEDHGLEVILAKDGQKALEILTSDPDIDLVFMDIMMPNMDGIEAIRLIREKPSLKKLPIIALTAKAMAEDKEQCLQAGATDYMTKPVDVKQMLSLVKIRLEE